MTCEEVEELPNLSSLIPKPEGLQVEARVEAGLHERGLLAVPSCAFSDPKT